MDKAALISIIIPIYGSFDIKRLLLSIDSVRMQKDVNFEIIVSEQGELRRVPEISGVKYFFNYHKPPADLSDFNPGEIRNIAIMNSIGKYIYTLDADVILPEPYFLKKLINHAENNPDIVKEVWANGNIIGNHTYSHFYLTHLSNEDIEDEFDEDEE